jgi:hypothetical protein
VCVEDVNQCDAGESDDGDRAGNGIFEAIRHEGRLLSLLTQLTVRQRFEKALRLDCALRKSAAAR